MDNVPSAAAQIIVSIIPMVGIVMGCLVVFYSLLLNHRQKIMMIEKGIYQKKEFDLVAFSLFTGLLLLSVGICLVVFFVIKQGFSYGVLSGLIPLSIGFSLMLYYIIRTLMKK